MHLLIEKFVSCVKSRKPEFFTGKKVLEVGSLDINGSVRKFFTDCGYTGIDLGEGKCVDIVAHVTDRRLDDFEFEVIISTEALEHDEKWNASLRQMYRLLTPGGLLLITCAGPGRDEHGTAHNSPEASPSTLDYYRNISIEDFTSILPADLFERSYLGYCGAKEDLYFAGIKRLATVGNMPQVDYFVTPSREGYGGFFSA